MSSNPSGSGRGKKQPKRSLKGTKPPAKGGVRIRAVEGSKKNNAKVAKRKIDVNAPEYAEIDDPKDVVGPVPELVCLALKHAWTVNPSNSMGFIFDVINPVRKFKRGAEYDENSDSPYAEYDPDPEHDPNVTETDEDATTQPYNPQIYDREYRWKNHTTTAETFLQWGQGELRTIQFGKPKKGAKEVDWKTRIIPAPYCRLIHQLLAEETHGKYNNGHEAQRRLAYARDVLDAFGDELERAKAPGPRWRSKVLTPILQRQLQGVSDVYGPAVNAAIASVDGDPTIADATRFYLSQDPLDNRLIPFYRRNLVVIREMKWHLAVLIRGPESVEDVDMFNDFLVLQDDLNEFSHELEEDDGTGEIPPFSIVEVRTLVMAGLEEYFSSELAYEPDHIQEEIERLKRTKSLKGPSPSEGTSQNEDSSSIDDSDEGSSKDDEMVKDSLIDAGRATTPPVNGEKEGKEPSDGETEKNSSDGENSQTVHQEASANQTMDPSPMDGVELTANTS